MTLFISAQLLLNLKSNFLFSIFSLWICLYHEYNLQAESLIKIFTLTEASRQRRVALGPKIRALKIHISQIQGKINTLPFEEMITLKNWFFQMITCPSAWSGWLLSTLNFYLKMILNRNNLAQECNQFSHKNLKLWDFAHNGLIYIGPVFT